MLISKNNAVSVAVYSIAVLSLVFFLAVAHPFELYFLNDDFIHIPLAAAGNFFHSNLLRPVSDLTLWVDHWIWGKNAFGFHLTNILIHLINTYLAYKLCIRLFKTSDSKHIVEKAVLASAFFLVYAFHSESLFWIIGRGGSLAALFMLVSLNCYVRSKNIPSLLISLVSFVTGLFTYEFVWILPAIILLFQTWDFYNKRSSPWRWSMSFGIVFIIYLLIRLNIDTAYFSNYETGSLLEFRIFKLVSNYCATVTRCFLPPVHDTKIFVGLTILLWIAVVGSGIYLIKKRSSHIKYAVFPFLCFLIACLPSVSLGIDTHDSEGERFLYVPSLFFCWFIVEMIFVLFRRMQTKFACILIVFSVHCYYLYGSAKDYRYAGSVVRNSLVCIGHSPTADLLIVEDLPTQYGGALIFRMGFENALQWTLPGKFMQVKILSYSEITSPTSYHCAMTGMAEHPSAIKIKWNTSGQIYFSEVIR